MRALAEALEGNFTFVNLGCIGDPDLPLPKDLRRTLTVVEIDAEGDSCKHEAYGRRIQIRSVVSDREGPHAFRRNRFVGCCSLLEPDEKLISQYGLERYYDLIERATVDCTTIPSIQKEYGLRSVDMLKLDLEGMDFRILKTCEPLLGKILFIKTELRFQPFYETEPFFWEVCGYLSKFGYEVFDIEHIDRWKYKTSRRKRQLKGRAVWGDFVFVLRPEVFLNSKCDAQIMLAKQILIAAMLGRKNFAEFLLDHYSQILPGSWRKELQPCLDMSSPRFPDVVRALRNLLRPVELSLKYLINRSEHCAFR